MCSKELWEAKAVVKEGRVRGQVGIFPTVVWERDEHLGVNLCTQAPGENVIVVKTYVK